MEWTADLATGIDEIDDQHREIFRRANALLAAMREGKGRAQIEPTLEYLRSYCLEHFALEEATMVRTGYHASAEMRAQHQDFVARLQEIARGHRDGVRHNMVVIGLVDYLMTLLKSHIGEADRQFARFLRNDKSQDGVAALRAELKARR